MSPTSIHHRASEPSFFYMLMAQSCFRRAVSTRHPKAGDTLRQTGRNYLAKANCCASGPASRSRSCRPVAY